MSLGCEIGEVTVAQPEDVVIAEAQVILGFTLLPGTGDPGPDPTFVASALLHRTFGPMGSDVPGASVRVFEAGGAEVVLASGLPEECLLFESGEEEGAAPPPGTCYKAELPVSPFAPGDRLSFEATTPDGRVMVGETRVPGSFSLTGLDHLGSQCHLPPESNYRISWTAAVDTWAYLGESNIFGLDVAYAPRGIDAPPILFLDGLAIGVDDTEIVFPAEFGVFDRFDLEGGLAQALQEGLPDGTRAEIALSALDRNWVNWARGGNFNPSGAVRIPSVFGDGTGVFGSGVRHRFGIVSTGAPSPFPLCGPVEP